jgi:hypothetical protein
VVRLVVGFEVRRGGVVFMIAMGLLFFLSVSIRSHQRKRTPIPHSPVSSSGPAIQDQTTWDDTFVKHPSGHLMLKAIISSGFNGC